MECSSTELGLIFSPDSNPPAPAYCLNDTALYFPRREKWRVIHDVEGYFSIHGPVPSSLEVSGGVTRTVYVLRLEQGQGLGRGRTQL